MAPLTYCLTLKTFHWDKLQQQSFKEIKEVINSSPVLAMPSFTKLFQVEIDASAVGIGIVLSQDGRPITLFNEKLSTTR